MKSKLFLITAASVALALPSLAADPAIVAKYNTLCASCHAKDGSGNTTMGKKIGAKNFTDPKVVAEIKDDHALKNLKEGVKKDGKELKKPFAGKISEDEMKALIEHCKKGFVK